MKRVVITGPTGAIGIALTEQMIQHNIEVVAVCRKGSPRIKNLPVSDLVQVVECNLNEIEHLPAMVPRKCDIWYHFGWDGTFGNSRNNMYGQLENIRYTLDAVEAASKMGCSVFIGAGSQAEYGRVEGKLNSDTPAFPENGYGMAKLCAGQMSRGLCMQKGIKHIWTRILSIYGPYDGENTMISSTILKLLSDQRPILTKGEQMWDYLYSKDAAFAMYLLGEYGQDQKVYTIGSGVARPLREYMEIVGEKCNPDIKLGIGELPYTENQVMFLCADISDLQKDTGFRPQYSFEKGIVETIEWFKENRR